jgi:hypothetical protein
MIARIALAGLCAIALAAPAFAAVGGRGEIDQAGKVNLNFGDAGGDAFRGRGRVGGKVYTGGGRGTLGDAAAGNGGTAYFSKSRGNINLTPSIPIPPPRK